MQNDSLQNRVHEAVFGFKEAGLKLGVTTWSRGSCNQCIMIFIFIFYPKTHGHNGSMLAEMVLVMCNSGSGIENGIRILGMSLI